jgi:hypothetical protein
MMPPSPVKVPSADRDEVERSILFPEEDLQDRSPG